MGFLRAPTPDPAWAAWWEKKTEGDDHRVRGAFDRGRCVAMYRSFPQVLTAVGGAPVPADAVANVTVSPTHRRRGLLSRMLAADLAEARDRGDVVATLIASEYPIYGRYGFGPAASVAGWEIDVFGTGLARSRAVPYDGARIDLVDGADVRRLGPGLHERFRARQHGAIDRDEHWWSRQTTGQPGNPSLAWTEPFHALCRSSAGDVEGLVTYHVDDVWDDGRRSRNTLTVRDLIALNPAAERALWRYLCSLDWITAIRTGHRATDDLLPPLLPDRRAARLVTWADWLWVRILDVVRALEARTYAAPGTLVLEIVDNAWCGEDRAGRGLAAGRFRLEAGPDGALCARTTESATLTLSAGDLASLWLGEESAVRLAALGRVTEHRPGAVATADLMFRTARRPWCPDIF